VSEASLTPALPAPGPAEAPPPVKAERTLPPAQWGMIAFLVSEVAFFSTLVMAYLTLMGKDTVGPTPREAIESMNLVVLMTICLLSSSATIHMAEKALHAGNQAGFCLWWALTILLGVLFLGGTAIEWREFIVKHHLTISRNLFGTSYYTLVGFHAAHVTGGVVAMSILLGLALGREVTVRNQTGVQMVAWYWHFVDVVWVVVFTVVYLVSRNL